MTTPLLPHGCGHCTNRWAGTNTAHCGTCHVTMSSPSAFDAHRRDHGCVNPATVGLVRTDRAGYQVWGYPAADPATYQQINARSAA